ncbi:MAG: enoyl-CoA hydratase-related protein [Arenimonas sp.]
MSDTVLLERRGTLATLTLNRPDSHNAFDAGLISDLEEALAEVEATRARCLVVTGAGHTFSAGADLNWMRDMARAPEDENFEDAMALARCLRRLDNLPIPVLARVNGSAYGGGVGLLACCDIAVGVDTAKFTLSEVKLGLVPAVISPYVIAAIGARHARRYFLSAEIFDAAQALHIGLLHEAVPASQLDECIDRIVHWIGKAGPKAVAAAKQLIREYSPAGTLLQMENQDKANAELIARLRVSTEGQEGITAFLEKRPSGWIEQ